MNFRKISIYSITFKTFLYWENNEKSKVFELIFESNALVVGRWRRFTTRKMMSEILIKRDVKRKSAFMRSLLWYWFHEFVDGAPTIRHEEELEAFFSSPRRMCWCERELIKNVKRKDALLKEELFRGKIV